MATISNAARSAACDAVVGLIDGGSGAGVLKLYTATQPAGPDTAITSQTLLSTLTFSDPAFGAASNGVATASAITPGTDDASGTAAWARIETSSGTAVMDLTVGTSGSDLNFNSVTFTASGASVSISSLTVTMPAS